MHVLGIAGSLRRGSYNRGLLRAALLIACPEYNYGVTGVLKNAIDWISRPPATSPLRRKPIAIMGASGGNFGTVRAQLALRQTLLFTEPYVLLKPEILVRRAEEHFDQEGNLRDEPARHLIAAMLVELATWIERMGS